jgi:hypothetical protein
LENGVKMSFGSKQLDDAFDRWVTRTPEDALYQTDEEVDILSYGIEPTGDWVCVNVAYDMTLEEAYDTCIHECSHKAFDEIFAEGCEENITKCLEVIK